MQQLSLFVIGVLIIVHLAFMFLEMYPFTGTPILLQTLSQKLGFTDGQERHASPILRNAGLFNGFIAAGLVWGLISSVNPFEIRLFFLICISIAGVYGSMSLPTKKPVLLQTCVALVGIALLMSC